MDCSIKKGKQLRIVANGEQLWTVASKEQAMEGLQLIKSEQQKDCNRLKSVSNRRVASSKMKHGQDYMNFQINTVRPSTIHFQINTARSSVMHFICNQAHGDAMLGF